MLTSDPCPRSDRTALMARRRRTRAYVETVVFLIVLVVTAGVAMTVDLFEQLVELTRKVEAFELDEVFTGLITTSLLALAFCGRRMADLSRTIDDIDAIAAERSRDWQRLCDAIETIDAGFALWDSQDRLVLCNDRYRAMFPSVREVMREGVPFEAALGVYYEHLQTLFPDRPLAAMREERLRLHRRGGTSVYLDPFGRWIRSDDRRTWDGGTVSLRTDISLMKQREIDLEHAAVHAEHQAHDLGTLAEQLSDALRTAQSLRVQAEEANIAKSNFLATMSHELRTPLNAIIGFSDIIKNRSFGEEWIDRYYSYAEDIHDSGIHLLNIINQILDLSRIESGNVELNVQSMDVQALLSGCCELIRHEIQSKRIDLDLDDVCDHCEVWADERSVKQILFNILSNAIKYTPEYGQIRIAADGIPDGGLEITVADTGIGIPENEMARLFRPFERMDTGYTSSIGGSGLGLPIVQSLMEAHGGSISIDSTPGRGTTVVLRFPKPADGADRGDADEHAPGMPAAAPIIAMPLAAAVARGREVVRDAAARDATDGEEGEAGDDEAAADGVARVAAISDAALARGGRPPAARTG